MKLNVRRKIIYQTAKALFVCALAVSLPTIPALSNYFMTKVYAGTLTTAKVTISDSRAGRAATTHAFQFTTATTGTVAKVVFEYCTSSTGNCIKPTGLTLTTTLGSASGIGAGTGSLSNSSGQTNNQAVYTVTSPASINSGVTISIPWTSVTNPTTADTSFFINIRTLDGSDAVIDTAQVAAAVLTSTSITVSAAIGPTFEFEVTGVNTTATTVNGANITVDTSSTANAIPFGTISNGSTNIAAHDVRVLTNATNGYAVTVKYIDGGTSAPLADGTNNIDNFANGAGGTNASPATWISPAGVAANTNTGYFGYTTEDNALDNTGEGTNRFGSNEWAGFSTSPETVVYNASAPSGGEETTRVGWQVEINELQPAGSYTGTLVLVATPTY